MNDFYFGENHWDPVGMAKQRNGGLLPGEDLRAQLHFGVDTGQIWLREHRMLLVHAEAQALLRKELIDTLGLERAKGILLRMGYASGVRDAELSLERSPPGSDLEAFMTGPRLHALEGIVRVIPVKIELDRAQGRFFGEFIWEDSWEGQWHRRHYGLHTEPVCWTQIGYASGYTSAFMGRTILYKETECSAMGHDTCRIVGKPVEAWEDGAEQMRYFNPEPIAEQLLDLNTQVSLLRSTLAAQSNLPEDMAGGSPAFAAAYKLLTQAASSRITVLILGETGVGKELFARRLHQLSPRHDGPFVAVNCAAIPQELVESELFGVEKGAYTGAIHSRAGRFERAHGGTLFLDEVGDLPLAVQVKLLRALQEGEIERLGDERPRKVDVRLVAATNVSLQQLVKEGRFRSDLYYRLNAYQITIPPLRERKQDIPLLAKHFLAKHAAINGKKLRGFSDKAKRALLSYAWPGNIRELQNMVERGVILASNGGYVEVRNLFPSYGDDIGQMELGIDRNGSIGLDRWAAGEDLFDAVFNGTLTLEQLEEALLETAVDKARGNLSAAARFLGITRPQLAYRLKRMRELGKDTETARTP